MRIEFKKEGTFESLYAATAWCKEHGLTVGQSSATGPSGLLFGDYGWIAKWYNLTPQERKDLHGTMSGDFRDGPVIITLNDSAVKVHAPYLLEQGADAPGKLMDEAKARKQFAAYFLDLKEGMAAEGGKVEKFAEWNRCIEHWIEEGLAPAEATTWKCPRSLEAELKQ